MLLVLLGTQERVRTSRGKRALIVRAIEVLLYSFQLPDLIFTEYFIRHMYSI